MKGTQLLVERGNQKQPGFHIDGLPTGSIASEASKNDNVPHVTRVKEGK
jgi:hypothetical protein